MAPRLHKNRGSATLLPRKLVTPWAALFAVVVCIGAGESQPLITATGQRLRSYEDVNVDDEELDFFRLPTKEEEDASFGYLEPHAQQPLQASVYRHTAPISTDGAHTLSLSKPAVGASGLRMRMAEDPSLGKALVWGKPKAIPVNEHAYREVQDTVERSSPKAHASPEPQSASSVSEPKPAAQGTKPPAAASPGDRQKCTVVIPLPDAIPSAPVMDISRVPHMCKVTVTCGGEDMGHRAKRRRLLGTDGSGSTLLPTSRQPGDRVLALAPGYGHQLSRRRLQQTAADNALLKQLASRFEVLQQKMSGAGSATPGAAMSPEQRTLAERLTSLERQLMAQQQAAAAAAGISDDGRGGVNLGTDNGRDVLKNRIAELEAKIRARGEDPAAVLAGSSLASSVGRGSPPSSTPPSSSPSPSAAADSAIGSSSAAGPGGAGHHEEVSETRMEAPAARTSRGGFMRPDSESIIAGIRMFLNVDEKHTCVGIKRACGDIGKRMALELSKGSLKRCAVIGMSPNIKSKRYGPEIDAHDTVIRMDSMLIKGQEWHMGTKTTIAFIRNIMAGGVVKYNQPKSFFLYRSKSMRSPVGKYQGLPYASLQSLSGTTAADELYQKLLRFSLLPAEGLQPSDSMVLVMALIHSELCTRIDLYGFDVETGSELNDGGSLTYNPGLEYFVYRVAMANNMLCVHDTAPYP